MAEKRVIELEVKDNVQSLKKQFREAQEEVQRLALAYGESSKEATEAAKRAAELKDVIDDTTEAIKNFQGGGSFTAVASSLGAVSEGFGAVQGAINLVGVESEDVENAILRLQSAMALAQGLQGLEDAGRSFKALGAVVQETFKGIRGALLATGIGAFVVAVGALAANWDKVKKALFGATEEQEAYNETIEDYNNGAKSAIEQTNKVKASFDLARKGVISKEEALKTYNDELGNAFGKAKSLNEAEELYNKKTEAFIRATALRTQAQALFSKSAEKQAEAVTQNLEDQTTFLDKSISGFKTGIFGVEEGLNELDRRQAKRRADNEKKLNKEAKTIEELATKLLKEAEITENAVGIKSEAEQKLEEDRKARAEAQRQRAKEELDQLKGFIKEATDYTQSLLRNEQENELKAIEEKYAERIKLAKKLGKGEDEIREAMLNEMNDVRTKYASEELRIEKENQDKINQAIKDAEQQRLDDEEAFFEEYRQNTQSQTQLEIDAVEEKYFNLIELAKKYGQDTTELERRRDKEIADIDKASKEEAKQREQDLQDFRYNVVSQGLSLITELANTFAGENEKAQRRAFNIKKAVGIAETTIDTFRAAQSVFAAASANPTTVLFPAQPFIQAGLAVASGLAKVAAISRTKFGGSASASSGGASGGGVGNIPQPQAPNVNIVGNANVNQLEALGQKPVQAYVVSGEVTTAQALDRNRVQNATFG